MNDFMSAVVTSGYTVKIIWSIIWLVAIVIANKMISRILFKTIKDNGTYHQAKKTANYSLSVVLIIVLIFIWMESTKNLATYAGLLSAGVAISLRELFSNMAGWVFIVTKKTFRVGDRILIGDQKGDVIDIRLFQFSLMELSASDDGEQSTGRIIDVPNYYILTYPLINYTKGFEYIWNEIKVLLTFESDWKGAKKLLEEIITDKEFHEMTEVDSQIKNAAKRYRIHYSTLTPIVYTDVKDSGVQLTLRYLCAPKQKRTTVNIIWEEVLEMIDTHEDIDLAYPTKRVVNL